MKTFFNKFNIYFKRPEYVSKKFYSFFWLGIISMLLGIAAKIYVISFLGEKINDMVMLNHPKEYWDSKPGGNPLTIEVSMLVLQILIMILTLVIYPLSIWKQSKIMKGKETLNKKSYKIFKKEYLLFLSIFLFLDVFTTGTLFYYAEEVGYQTVFTTETIITVATILIPTPLAIWSLVKLKSLKLEIK